MLVGRGWRHGESWLLINLVRLAGDPRYLINPFRIAQALEVGPFPLPYFQLSVGIMCGIGHSRDIRHVPTTIRGKAAKTM